MSSAAAPVKGRPLSTAEGFLCGGAAACVAVSTPARWTQPRLTTGLECLGHILKSAGSGEDALAVAGRAGEGWRGQGVQTYPGCLAKDVAP